MLLHIVEAVAISTSVLSLIPQIIQSHRTRSMSDVSMWMLFNFAVCAIAWIIYGLWTGATAVWLCNIIFAAFSLYLMALKYWYDRAALSTE